MVVEATEAMGARVPRMAARAEMAKAPVEEDTVETVPPRPRTVRLVVAVGEATQKVPETEETAATAAMRRRASALPELRETVGSGAMPMVLAKEAAAATGATATVE
jgi:hypothetical protein